MLKSKTLIALATLITLVALIASSIMVSAAETPAVGGPAPGFRLQDQNGEWHDLADYRGSAELVPLDQFFARLFGEVLSQPGYGFHQDYDAARVANQLVESAKNFRWALEGSAISGNGQTDWRVRLGREYVQLFESGALGSLYVPGWRVPDDAVFLAPAYTYLMRNSAVEIQFWLDIGAGGERVRLAGNVLDSAMVPRFVDNIENGELLLDAGPGQPIRRDVQN